MASPFTAALIQMNAGPALAPNLDALANAIRDAKRRGADIVFTPENSSLIEPDRAALMAKAFPEADHPALPVFADLARETGLWLAIGSIQVKISDRQCANRALLFDPRGRLVQRYDKIHMFDVDLANGERYRESANFRPGSAAAMADLPWGRLGLTICYDLRFAYLHRALAQAGADFLAVPAAFTQPTGRAHWHLLLRARAIETGCFVFAAAQVGEHAEGRRTYGHSLIVAPWGEVLAETGGERPEIVMARIDPAKVAEARSMIPALHHDRAFAAPDDDLIAAAER